MLTKKVLVSASFVVGTIGVAVTPLSSMAQVAIQLNMGPPPQRSQA